MLEEVFVVAPGVVQPLVRAAGFGTVDRRQRHGFGAEQPGAELVPVEQRLVERFVVGDDKNQELKFSMTKLPGRLSFQAHRSDRPAVLLGDARVFIDGQEVKGISAAGVGILLDYLRNL